MQKRFAVLLVLILAWAGSPRAAEITHGAGVSPTMNAWALPDGEIVTAWAPHPQGRPHRSYYQVLFCDLPESADERAIVDERGPTPEESHQGLRFKRDPANPWTGTVLWEEYCALNLYALGQKYIKRERSPRGWYAKAGRREAHNLAQFGWTDGLTADEYLCAYHLAHPPEYLAKELEAHQDNSYARAALVRMEYDPKHDEDDRARFEYYGIDHVSLCGGLTP